MRIFNKGGGGGRSSISRTNIKPPSNRPSRSRTPAKRTNGVDPMKIKDGFSDPTSETRRKNAQALVKGEKVGDNKIETRKSARQEKRIQRREKTRNKIKGGLKKLLGRLFGKNTDNNVDNNPNNVNNNTNNVDNNPNNVNNNTDNTIPTPNPNPNPAPAPAPAPEAPSAPDATPATANANNNANVKWAGGDPEAEKLFDAGMKASGFKDENGTRFNQGGQRNCVTTAAVKMGMEVYDKDFMKFQKTDKGFDYQLQNGTKGSVTHKEFAEAKSRSGFYGKDDGALGYATAAYAAAAKEAQKAGHGSYSRGRLFRRGTYDAGFNGALRKINNGIPTSNGLDYVGLKHKWADPKELLNRADLKNKELEFVGYSNNHAFRGNWIDGKYFLDVYGDQKPVNSFRDKAFNLNGAYILDR